MGINLVRLIKFNLCILVMLLSSIAFAAFAQKVDAYELKNLSPQEQKEYIRLVQKYFVQIEQMQLNKLEKNNQIKNVKLIIYNLFVQKAYAAQKNSKLCLYAGWISYIPSWSDKCSHPKHLSVNKIPKEIPRDSLEYRLLVKDIKEYKKLLEKNKSCNNPKNIFCNQQVFGQQLSGKPFCAIGNKDSQNSSFDCLKQVDRHPDSEIILDNIINDVTASKEAAQRFNSVLNLIDDTCICNAQSTMMDESYKKRMFKSQTCFAWAKQSSRIGNYACSLKTSSTTTDEVQKIIRFTSQIKDRAEHDLLKSKITSKEYEKLLSKGWSTNENNWTQRAQSYELFCKLQEQRASLALSIEPLQDKNAYYIIAHIKNANPNNFKWIIPKNVKWEKVKGSKEPKIIVFQKKNTIPIKGTLQNLQDQVKIPPFDLKELKATGNPKDSKQYDITANISDLKSIDPIYKDLVFKLKAPKKIPQKILPKNIAPHIRQFPRLKDQDYIVIVEHPNTTPKQVEITVPKQGPFITTQVLESKDPKTHKIKATIHGIKTPQLKNWLVKDIFSKKDLPKEDIKPTESHDNIIVIVPKKEKPYPLEFNYIADNKEKITPKEELVPKLKPFITTEGKDLDNPLYEVKAKVNKILDPSKGKWLPIKEILPDGTKKEVVPEKEPIVDDKNGTILVVLPKRKKPIVLEFKFIPDNKEQVEPKEHTIPKNNDSKYKIEIEKTTPKDAKDKDSYQYLKAKITSKCDIQSISWYSNPNIKIEEILTDNLAYQAKVKKELVKKSTKVWAQVVYDESCNVKEPQKSNEVTLDNNEKPAAKIEIKLDELLGNTQNIIADVTINNNPIKDGELKDFLIIWFFKENAPLEETKDDDKDKKDEKDKDESTLNEFGDPTSEEKKNKAKTQIDELADKVDTQDDEKPKDLTPKIDGLKEYQTDTSLKSKRQRTKNTQTVQAILVGKDGSEIKSNEVEIEKMIKPIYAPTPGKPLPTIRRQNRSFRGIR
ncbi:MAG: hypothetical protein N4A33_12275 [Bacteriovoracaceae bacterium]|jgi:hypothetical protein|nr:hypothetical protein [Bacteriovoracaceae bacterium]